MARNMTLRGTIELSTRQWNKAINSVKASLNKLKMMFMGAGAAMVGGFGIDKLVDAAKKMDQAQTTLKNVSGGEYANNQKFLIDLAQKYNQEIITLTGNFSKFHASSNEANVNLEDQKKIFESLTRASAYFNLSADESNSVFLAVTQMMSKGKVSAEELRRQLGERLPGAFGIMAKAAGMTTAELDQALRTGKLMSADILPKFADELNRVTANLDTDTIQGWTNRLQTSIVGLSNKLHIGDIYKGVVKYGSKSIDWITKNIRSVWGMLGGLALSIPTTLISKFQNGQDKLYDGMEEKLNREMMHNMNRKMNVSAMLQDYGGLDTKLNPIYDSNKRPELDPKGNKIPVKMGIINKEAIKDKKALKEINREINAINKSYEVQAQLVQDLNGRLTFGQRIVRNLKNFALNTGIALAFNAAIAGAGALIGKITDIYTRVKRTRKEIEKMNQEWEKFKNQESPEATILQTYLDEYNSITGTDNEALRKREVLLSAMNDILKSNGMEELKYGTAVDKVNSKIASSIGLLNDRKNSDQAASLLNASKNNLKDLKENQLPKAQAEYEAAKAEYDKVAKNVNPVSGALAFQGFDVKDKLATLDSIKEQIASEEDNIKKYGDIVKSFAKSGGMKGSGNEDFDLISTMKANYEKEVELLKRKLKDGAIDQEKYNSAISSLAERTLDQLYAIENVPTSAMADYEAFKKQLLGSLKRKSDPTPRDKYDEKKRELDNQLERGAITQEEWNGEMVSLIGETQKALAGMDSLTGSLKKFAGEIDKYQNLIKEERELQEALKDEQDWQDEQAGKAVEKYEKHRDYNKNKPQEKKRDSTFDFSKEESEILEEMLSNKQEYIDQLNSAIESVSGDPELIGYLQELQGLLIVATKEADNLDDALKLSKLTEMVKGYQKELMSGVGSLEHMASGFDRIRAGIESLNNPDITGFEKMLAVLNMIIQTTQTLISTMEMFESVKKTLDALTGAEEALGEATSANTQKTLAETGATIMAKQGEATASGTAEAAKLPFPANLAAIAAVLATLGAVFASIPKFAKGGLIGGHSTTGDKLLARVNSGEMILSQKQQASLLNQLNGGGGKVQFEIRGDKLVGVLNNYQKKITK